MDFKEVLKELAVTEKSRLENGYIDLLIFGMNGTGKTPVASSVKDFEPTKNFLYLDIESNATIEGVQDGQLINAKALATEHKLSGEYAAVLNVLVYLEKLYENCLKEETSFPVDAIVLDGFTAIQKAIIKKLVPQGQVQIQHWGQALNLIDDLVYRFRSLPIHLIATANEYYRELPDKKVILTPQMTWSITNTIVGYFGLVGRLNQNVSERTITFKPSSTHMTRDRLGLHKTDIKNPTIQKIFEPYIKGLTKI